MPEASTPDAPALSEARCSRHPDRSAVATCTRCGAFICSADRRELDARVYCPDCVVHPDVDYLEAFRLKYWGQRDTWAWLAGIGGASYAFVAVVMFVGLSGYAPENRPLGIGVALAVTVMATHGICFFLGLRWARQFLFLWPVLGAGISIATGQLRSLPGSLVSGVLAAAIFFDTRNRLFFKVPVSRKQLQRAWNLYCNNQIARLGFSLSLLSLFVGPLALISLPMCIIGLRRVNPGATPPIGRKGLAIAGVALSSIAIVLWTSMLVASQLD